jgi:glycosyltransferase involved in cell wall biosynthesis
MKLALAGTRGVPAAYSGFETAVEQIGSRLADRGHDVTVYCRPHMVERRPGDTYRGMRLVYLPTVAGKHLDTPIHTLLSTLHLAAVERPDVALYFIAGNSPFAGLGRALGVPTAINVDGLDSQRAKWGKWARRYLRLTERAAPVLADVAITDSRTVQDLYRTWGHETVYIPYGSELEDEEAADTPASLGLSPGGYILFVGRLVPENNAHVLVDAYRQLDTGLRLAIVGDAPYADDYKARLHASGNGVAAAPGGCRAAPGGAAAGDRDVVFAGYQFGPAYRALLRNAAVVVVPTEVGGTHPVLLEAMDAGACIVVNDHAPNVETLGDAGVCYRGCDGAEGLRRALEALLADPAAMEACRAAAAQRARLYSWDAVTDAYERLAEQMLARRGRTPRVRATCARRGTSGAATPRGRRVHRDAEAT